MFHQKTGETREATVQDIIDSTRLLDALDQATTITPFFTPTDEGHAFLQVDNLINPKIHQVTFLSNYLEY